jgi:hypothetical protein
MDIDRFIKQDVIEFLEKEQHKDISISNVRSDEMTLFDIDKDFVKELDEQLKLNNVESGRELFNELRKIYNRTPEASPVRKKIFSILKEMTTLLNKYLKEHQVQSQATFEMQYYDKKEVFTQNTPPEKILTEDEEKHGYHHEQEDSYNLLAQSVGKGEGLRDIGDMVSQEIKRSIPLEESQQLREIFRAIPIQAIVQPQIIVQQTEPQIVRAAPPGSQAQVTVQEPQMMQAPVFIQQPMPQQTQVIMRTERAPSEVTNETIKKMVDDATREIKTGQTRTPEVTKATIQKMVDDATRDMRPKAEQTPDMSKENFKKMVEDVTRDYLEKQQPKVIHEKIIEKEIIQQSVKEQEKITPTTKTMLAQKQAAGPQSDERKSDMQETIDRSSPAKTPDTRITERIIERPAPEQKIIERIIEKPAPAKNPSQVKKEYARQELEEKTRIDLEKENIKKRQRELEGKLEELKKLKFYKEELELLREKEKKNQLLKTIDKIIESKKRIKDAIYRRNIPAAKKEYGTIKRLFQTLNLGQEKRELYKDLLSLFDQIRFAEKEINGPQQRITQPKEDLGALKFALLEVKRCIVQQKFTDAKEALAKARTTADSLQNEDLKKKTRELLDHYEERIRNITTKYDTYWQMKTGETPSTPQLPLELKDQANLYLKGVNFLYGNQKKEAATIFRQILSANPNNMAARIRLTEATC